MPLLNSPVENIRVSYDTNPNFARSESDLAANPLNPRNMVGASKRFIDPAKYDFTLAAYTTFDAGKHWFEAPPLQLLEGWDGISDPAVAWDGAGNAYLVALPFSGDAENIIGIAIYRSPDGGYTWDTPTLIHSSEGDDKQAACGDNDPRSPHFGNVYVAWDNAVSGSSISQLCFARSTDSGATWTGVGKQPPGSVLANDSFSPEVFVAASGEVYIIWLSGRRIEFVKSIDGGASFSRPAVAVTDLTPLSSPPLAAPDGFPQLPGGKFRVLSIPTGCAGANSTVVVGWADYRDGVSRIYYRRSLDGGVNWDGPVSGQPLLTGQNASRSNQHEFHPQLRNCPNGDIGCAFYEFGPPLNVRWGFKSLINVVLALSIDSASSFSDRLTVTTRGWDPNVDAPLSHGSSKTTFIGDYFGMASSDLGFFPFWTDTRTGIQEIFSARCTVNLASRYRRDPRLVFFHVDNPAGENHGYYRVAKDIGLNGIIPATSWSWTSPVDPRFEVPGWFGAEDQAGSIAVCDLDDSGFPDLVVFHIDNPSGENHGYYRIGLNMGADGTIPPFDWRVPVPIPGWFGSEDQGGGICIADLERTDAKDLIVFHIDNPGGENHGFYRVGKSMAADGSISDWVGPFQIPGWFGAENQGGGVAVADLDGNGSTDLIVFHIDNPGGENRGYYRVGKGMAADGTIDPINWFGPYEIPGWFGAENQGGGIAVIDLDGNGRPDLVVFHIDNPSGENRGYYRVGRNMKTDGSIDPRDWTGPQPIPGWFGAENQGAGVAAAWMTPGRMVRTYTRSLKSSWVERFKHGLRPPEEIKEPVRHLESERPNVLAMAEPDMKGADIKPKRRSRTKRVGADTTSQ